MRIKYMDQNIKYQNFDHNFTLKISEFLYQAINHYIESLSIGGRLYNLSYSHF